MANASSGMAVADECKLKFMELKRKKTYRYIIYKIENNEVSVEKTGAPGEDYAAFSASLPEADCRYAVFDYDFVTVDNCQRSKIFFIAWVLTMPTSNRGKVQQCMGMPLGCLCLKSQNPYVWSPDTSRVKSKMTYASSKDRFRRELEGIHFELQATDPTEMDFDVIKDRANK